MKPQMTRRELLQASMGAAAVVPGLQAGALTTGVQAPAAAPINKNSAPSGLKITDMRACTVASNYDYPIIRIDTNQGVYGLGEVRDAGVKGIALILKAHILGKNPLEIESILRDIRQFAGQGRMGGGYSAVDMALHDIAGKVYGVPAWRLLGTRYRDRIRIYCDTTGHKDPKIYGERMLKRKKMGFTFFKMDLYTSLVADRPGAVHQNGAATDKGLKYLCEYIEAVRDAIGWDAPLGADHFGNLSVNDSIRYARAFEPYQLAWAEDFIKLHGLARLQDHLRCYHHSHPHRRRCVRARGGIPEPDREPCGRHHPAGPGDLGRAARNQADRGLRRTATASRRSCTSPARRSGAWPPSTWRPRWRISSSWRTTPSTCPGGETWSRGHPSPSSRTATSRFRTLRDSAWS